MSETITVNNVDVPLLRKQRDELLWLLDESETTGRHDLSTDQEGHILGVINLLDTMLDVAEGYGENL